MSSYNRLMYNLQKALKQAFGKSIIRRNKIENIYGKD